MKVSIPFQIVILFLFLACQTQSENENNSSESRNETIKISSQESSISISCFVYHRFGEDQYPTTNIAINVFRQQLNYLKENDFQLLTLGEALSKLEKGGGSSRKIAVLTIDDGYKSFLTGAMPLLREYGFKATLFINTETVGARGYLTWNELNKIQKEGIEIGNHTHTHTYFLNEKEGDVTEKFRKDVKQAQALIKANLNSSPDLFAYPFGEYNQVMKKVVEELGFKAATAQNSGVIYGGSDSFALPRFPMGGPFATLDGFKEKAGMKAMNIEVISPQDHTVFKNEPPQLQVKILGDEVDLTRINCFVQGSKDCAVARDKNRFTFRSQSPLKSRRTLYTITAPSKDGSSWYWYSYLWIQPNIQG